MPKILVNLVSAETIPNVLFIKEHKDAQEIIFISTEKMEQAKKSKAILDASKANIPYKIIVTSADEPEKLEKDLSALQLDFNNDILVNITGGTKIMAIINYQFFSKRGAKIFYQPIGKPYFERIYPYPVERKEVNYQLSISEYLQSYNVNIINNSNKAGYTFEQCLDMFSNISLRFNREINSLREFTDNKTIKNRLKKTKKINMENETTVKILQKLNISKEREDNILSICRKFSRRYPEVTKNELSWILGGWLEELFWYIIKKNHSLTEKFLALSCQITKENVKNEIDVMAVLNNKLYLFECKTGMKVKFGDIINNTIYKVSSIKSKFGINASTYLVTLEEGLKEHHLERAKESHLTLIRREDLEKYINGEPNFLYAPQRFASSRPNGKQ